MSIVKKNNHTTHHATTTRKTLSAFEAISEAQKIAFAPMLFQAALNLRDSGIFALLDQAGSQGLDCQQLQQAIDLSPYAIQLLLDVGLTGDMIYQNDDGKYCLDKIGHFLLHDNMTKINMNFSQDVCYQGMFYLTEALKMAQPAGLRVFGDWPTIYPALSALPPKAQQSWFEFDHFYSDGAFEQALQYILKLSPKQLYDVGGNTGKWALCCAAQDKDLALTILDLPEQIALARENVAMTPYQQQIDFYPVDLLKAETLPGEADIWWMSQFLDCFSETQILQILKLIHRSMSGQAKVCIMETFWDRQPFKAGAFSLNASSLYFTCMANGKSRFYHSEVFYRCLQEAGFCVTQDIDGLGIGHTLLVCEKTN